MGRTCLPEKVNGARKRFDMKLSINNMIRIFGAVSFTLFLIPNIVASETPYMSGVKKSVEREANHSLSLELRNGSLFPSSKVSIHEGESVTFRVTDTPLTIRIRNANDIVQLLTATNYTREGKDLILPLRMYDSIMVQFLKTGDFEIRIDGINPDYHAYKCGVDVFKHFVEGVILVRD